MPWLNPSNTHPTEPGAVSWSDFPPPSEFEVGFQPGWAIVAAVRTIDPAHHIFDRRHEDIWGQGISRSASWLAVFRLLHPPSLISLSQRTESMLPVVANPEVTVENP